MRVFRTRLHAHVSLVLLACLVTGAIVILLLSRERVTRVNFEKIKLGMSQADVERLLGPAVETQPVCNTWKVWPQELREEGYQDCAFQRWSSARMTIILITDATGTVVDRFEFGDSSLVSESTFWETVWYWIVHHL
jgi:hypothetical protein